MSFHEIQFPLEIAYGTSGGPEYSTDVVELASGYEQRNVNWSEARARYNVAHAIKNQAQLDVVVSFFRARKGRAHGFRFRDNADYTATSQAIATGNGTATQFQLIKRYLSGSTTEIRTIKKPVSGTVKIYLNGTLQTSGVTIDTTTGIVTFTAAPANGVIVTADYEFDVPVRFDTDYLPVQLYSKDAFAVQNISVVELRV